MLQEAFGDFAAEKLRPAALEADADCAAPGRAARPGRRARASRCSASPRSWAASCRALGRDRRAGRRGAGARRHGPRRRDARAGRRRHGARAVGRRRPAGDLPARVHRRGRPRRGARDPGAAAAVRPVRARDHRPQGAATASCSTAPSRSSPRAAEGELFIVAAEIEGHGPALFIVESGAEGVLGRSRAGDGRARRRHRRRCPRGRAPARRAAARRRHAGVYAECVRRARLAWCALAVGTAQAVLDYVIPYVNERVAFGEPISNRQAVAFMVSDIAIELEGMRLATYRAAGRADPGKDFAREVALARELCADEGDADRLRRRAAARRPRLRQGAPGRALVPRPARSRRDGGRPARLGQPESEGQNDQPRDPEEVQAARRPGAPGREGGLPPDLAQVRPGRARVPEGARHARRADRRDERRHRARRRRRRRRPPRRQRRRTTARTATAPTCRRCSASSSCAGATSACCCRCRARASATRRSPRWRTTSSSSASAASGRRWRSPSPRPAPTRPRSAPPPCWTATSTCSTARRSTSPRASAPTWSSSGRRSTAASAARRSSRSSSSAPTRG